MPNRDRPTQQLGLRFRKLSGVYAVARLDPGEPVPDWASHGAFTSTTRTADELSIVCPAENLPAGVQSALRWTCLKLEGPFPFTQTGVLLSFIAPLSGSGIPIFTVSTFDTDYVLVPEEFAERAVAAVIQCGHVGLS